MKNETKLEYSTHYPISLTSVILFGWIYHTEKRSEIVAVMETRCFRNTSKYVFSSDVFFPTYFSNMYCSKRVGYEPESFPRITKVATVQSQVRGRPHLQGLNLGHLTKHKSPNFERAGGKNHHRPIHRSTSLVPDDICCLRCMIPSPCS